MILDNYDHKTGKSCRAVALRNLLARNGLELKEDFILGLGNGFTFSFVKPDSDTESYYFKCIAPNLSQFTNFAENMDLEYQVLTKAETDFDFIERVLKYDDNPVLCEVVPREYEKYLKNDGVFWSEIKMDVPLTAHVTEVIGVDEENVYFCENYSNAVFKIPHKGFKKAQNSNKDSYLNPHHRIHYFIIPDDIGSINMEEVVCKAIKSNMRDYCMANNYKLGLTAFLNFIDSFPNMYNEYGMLICKKSLLITGNLIKYVSPGMFRKIYSRFLKECIAIIGYEKELSEICQLLQKSDFLWNKLGAHMLKNNITVKECMTGNMSKKLLSELKEVELESVERLVEVCNAW